jgi:hypothetical protein
MGELRRLELHLTGSPLVVYHGRSTSTTRNWCRPVTCSPGWSSPSADRAPGTNRIVAERKPHLSPLPAPPGGGAAAGSLPFSPATGESARDCGCGRVEPSVLASGIGVASRGAACLGAEAGPAVSSPSPLQKDEPDDPWVAAAASRHRSSSRPGVPVGVESTVPGVSTAGGETPGTVTVAARTEFEARLGDPGWRGHGGSRM